ncbi:cytochrome P450 709B2-like [Phalaenopsis equestris]|uniref:cytochrome P450 709B2-like n=1 Tax=Phalaenopsis equestris TaxID=78828 RepID=UPI0009E2D7F8|nr:cytochrome P450 709B2-like [Phalaenopsis equestris]
MGYLELIVGALTVALTTWIWSFLVSFAWRPYLKAKRLREQGVGGPKGSFWSGCADEINHMKAACGDMVFDINSHDYLNKIFPHYIKWSSQYGGTFIYSIGEKTRLFISDPELIKEVLSNKFGFYMKLDPGAGITALLGKGLVLTDGEQWTRHKRVVNPAFTMERIKTMTRTMADCAKSMLDQWQDKKEVEVGMYLQELTADVISHTAFGSSYSAGKEVFLAQKELIMIVLASFLKLEFPIKKYLPTENNKHRWKLEKKLRGTLMSIIENRLASKEKGYGNDLLGLMMEACNTGNQGETNLSIDEIIDECKTFYFAGHETTSHLLTWTMFLLSTHQDWQERLREEVLSECGKQIPDPDKITKFKLMTMVIFEVLRLYSPVSVIARTARKDIKLGNLMIPKGMDIIIPIAIIHHSKELWGPDANEFNPLRFENGVSKAAKHPNAMMAFSIGPRACVGQNFALTEAKTVLCMILQRFSFTISPDYKHMPADRITLQPQKGLPIVLTPLEA